MTGVPNNDTTWSFSFVPESRKGPAVLPMWLYCVTFSGPRPKPGAVGGVEETSRQLTRKRNSKISDTVKVKDEKGKVFY